MHKLSRAGGAAVWTEAMSQQYSEEIRICIKETKSYDGQLMDVAPVHSSPVVSTIELYEEDSVSAVFNHSEGKTAVLNFASYKEPGGGFIYGSMAQEEALCHKSFLYNVLKEYDTSYYKWNRGQLCKGLYTDRALYTPSVLFFESDNKIECDVITCAAPNYSVGRIYGTVSKEENSKALKQRIEFVLKIASLNHVETLILGAYGCGVFQQDPNEVANLFLELLDQYKFKNVIFAIPNSSSDNYKAFHQKLSTLK